MYYSPFSNECSIFDFVFKTENSQRMLMKVTQISDIVLKLFKWK